MRLTALFTLITLVLAPAGLSAGDSGPDETLVVFLVRHAEKVDKSADPALSDAGHQRSATLAQVLGDVRLDGVHSTDFIRTRDTAAPVASVHQLEVELYDRNLAAMVEKLEARGGRHLVVGHSNTTPAGVELLGGDPGTAINEDIEYDRLYIVTSHPTAGASTVLIRYGEPSLPR